MKIGLFMMVKDESGQMEPCLAEIVDLFCQILIVDTGSVDGTPDELRSLGIEPAFDKLCPSRCNSHADVRNRGFAQLQSPWIMCLDADERIQRSQIERLVRSDRENMDALFCLWKNSKSNVFSFEDYKCSLFRKGIQKRGLIHDNVQFEIRKRGLRAVWDDELQINHFPDRKKMPSKQKSYWDRLRCAIALEPNWLRYRWFLGYMLFKKKEYDLAVRELMILHKARSPLFPVECLNASMVLAECCALTGQFEKPSAIINDALEFYSSANHDFEVKVNFRMKQWLDAALEASLRGELQRIRTYEFAS